jgi:hypothetical protein
VDICNEHLQETLRWQGNNLSYVTVSTFQFSIQFNPNIDTLLLTLQKKKGLFHHSSFLAGGATLAAGRLEAEDGILEV